MSSNDPDIQPSGPGAPGRIHTLIMGYGNELRRDDGAGPAVARMILDREIPNVAAETCHQLLPEHAARIATAGLVIFVDATFDSADEISVRRIGPAIHPGYRAHQCDPEELLDLCKQLVSRVPEAWFIRIPGADFGIGESLSPTAARHTHAAVSAILSIIRDHT